MTTSRAAVADDDDDCNKKRSLFGKGTHFFPVSFRDISLNFDDEVDSSRSRRTSLGWKGPFFSPFFASRHFDWLSKTKSREAYADDNNDWESSRRRQFPGLCRVFSPFLFGYIRLWFRLQRRSQEHTPPPTQFLGLEGSLFFDTKSRAAAAKDDDN